MRRIITRLMSSSAKEVAILHDKKDKVFRAIASDIELGRLEYRMTKKNSNDAVDFYHTYTSTAAQGRGIAAQMVTKGLEWARENQFVVVPTCSYVASFIQKNPQWKSSL